ncbi:MAG: hypothetical protein H0W88_03080 [Parachlamydiaceae bacterium]|nr:hypothetical protein [Parachlamydiaceae bacterium]
MPVSISKATPNNSIKEYPKLKKCAKIAVGTVLFIPGLIYLAYKITPYIFEDLVERRIYRVIRQQISNYHNQDDFLDYEKVHTWKVFDNSRVRSNRSQYRSKEISLMQNKRGALRHKIMIKIFDDQTKASFYLAAPVDERLKVDQMIDYLQKCEIELKQDGTLVFLRLFNERSFQTKYIASENQDLHGCRKEKIITKNISFLRCGNDLVYRIRHVSNSKKINGFDFRQEYLIFGCKPEFLFAPIYTTEERILNLMKSKITLKKDCTFSILESQENDIHDSSRQFPNCKVTNGELPLFQKGYRLTFHSSSDENVKPHRKSLCKTASIFGQSLISSCMKKLTEKCVANWFVGEGLQVKVLLFKNKLTVEVFDKKNKKKLHHDVIVNVWKTAKENISELQKSEIVVNNDGTVGFYQQCCRWLFEGREITVSRYGSSFIARIRKDGGVLSNVYKFQSNPEIEKRISDNSCLVFVDRENTYNFVLPTHTWKFDEFEVSLLYNDKIFVYNIHDKKTKKNYQTPIKVPADKTIEEMAICLSHCSVVVENYKVKFVPPHFSWPSGVSLLIADNAMSLIWNVFNKETGITKQIPFTFSSFVDIQKQIEYFLTDPARILRKEKILQKRAAFKFVSKVERDTEIAQKKLRTTKIDKNECFIQHDKIFYYEFQNDETYSWYSFNMDEDVYLKEMINYFLDYHMYAVEKNYTNYKITATSRVDNQTRLDKDNWAITLVDSGTFKKDDPKTWGGHAQLLVEGVDKGAYFIKMVDFVGAVKFIPEAGTVRLDDLTGKDPRYASKTRTWIKKSQDIQYWLSEIKHEVDLNVVRFSLLGKDSILTPEDVQNCITWARNMLKRIGIDIDSEVSPKKEKGIIDRINVLKVITTPKEYTMSPQLKGNEHVKFRYQNGGKVFDVDIAYAIREKVGAKDWVLDVDPFGKDIKTIKSIKNGINSFHEKFLVKILVNGKTELVDVTDAILAEMMKVVEIAETTCLVM